MSAELIASRRDGALILTISNPGADNALHPDMYAAAIETLTTAERDDSIRTVVLTGAGSYFCCGSGSTRQYETQLAQHAAYESAPAGLSSWVEAIRDCPKLVIAAIDGKAVDAGFSLALACDLIVAGQSAQFGMNWAHKGQVPQGGASWFLTKALPRQLAIEILAEGKPLAATRLHQLGIVNRLVADGGALDGALAWSDQLALVPSYAIERIKTLVREAQASTLAQLVEMEEQHAAELAAVDHGHEPRQHQS